MTDLNGILVVDKPSGWTSNDVVQKTKNLIGGAKVGHTGTLDPMATGVLVLLIGRATKLASKLAVDAKRYTAVVTFGSATDTYDAEGVVTATGDPSCIDREILKQTINGLKGIREQVPPMFSAKKIRGKKLYELARSGKTIERKSVPIEITDISFDDSAFPEVTIDISCSKGTYIRSIAHELGRMMGCPSHLSRLRRTEAGIFTLRDVVDFSTAATSNDSKMLIDSIRAISEK